jgi:hypothetical protein
MSGNLLALGGTKRDPRRETLEMRRIRERSQPSIGQASVYNIVNSQYTGIIYGTAELDFYPATKQYPAPPVADAVYPLSAGATGGYVYLETPADQMTARSRFPLTSSPRISTSS